LKNLENPIPIFTHFFLVLRWSLERNWQNLKGFSTLKVKFKRIAREILFLQVSKRSLIGDYDGSVENVYIQNYKEYG